MHLKALIWPVSWDVFSMKIAKNQFPSPKNKCYVTINFEDNFLIFFNRELKRKPKKSKSRSNSTAGTLKKQKSIKEKENLIGDGLLSEDLPWWIN